MWELIKAPDRIVAEVPIWKCYGLHFKEALRHPLPFYDNAYLVKAVYEEDEYVGISAGEHVFWLDGTSRPIHAANRALGLKLTEQNVAQYLSSFCGFIGFETEAVIGGISPVFDGYHVKAIMAYQGDLYSVDMSVSSDGSVLMLDYHPTRGRRGHKGPAIEFAHAAMNWRANSRTLAIGKQAGLLK